MRRAIGGDQVAYADLLVLLTTAARRYVRGKAGDVPWIDDAVQETLIRASSRRDQYDPDRGKLSTWVHAIATNVCLDMLRSAKRRALVVDLHQATGPGLHLCSAPGWGWLSPVSSLPA